VPISQTLRAELERAAALRTSDYVVEYRGDRVRSIKTGFGEAVERAGLKGVTPHVLRHTAASWMAQDGVRMEEIAGFLGNSTEVTERVYAKHSPDYMRAATAALDARVSSSNGRGNGKIVSLEGRKKQAI
jgi:integrase